MKKIAIILILALMAVAARAQRSYDLLSPDGQIKVAVSIADKISYKISCGDSLLLDDGVIAMTLSDGVLGENPRVSKVTRKSVDEKIHPVVAFKTSEIVNRYNQLLIALKGGYSVEFRAFDDGVAYRLATDRKGEVEVVNELFQVKLPADYTLHLQQAGSFRTAYEEPYEHFSADEWNAPTGKVTLLPLLIEANANHKVLISESDVTDYPCMMLTNSAGSDMLASVFPRMPLEFGEGGDRWVNIVKEAEYIARTSGKRTFPWRYFVITTSDGQLVENTMTARLAQESRIDDISWLKPGVTTWDWMNGATPYGPDVDFEGGRYTEPEKYFVDFAVRFGIPYILLDEGWAKSTRDSSTPNDKLNLKEVVDYATQNGVGVILWLPWLTVENTPGMFEEYEKLGIKGVKIDFMDRSDQWMVNFYERVAAEAAKHKIFVDYHGAFKPAGLEYMYPNILTYEGVRGLENMGNCRADNNMYMPFMRNAVGPMDFTPGAMSNYQPERYGAHWPNIGGMGTRANQMAMYVLFETGLQMLADNPVAYCQNEDCTRFMAGVPVESDETLALDAKVGEYLVAAKRKGDKWYVGGMAGEKGHATEVVLDFLEPGRTYTMTSFEDGVNAHYQAMHYNKKTRQVRKGDKVAIDMCRNGGYAAVIE